MTRVREVARAALGKHKLFKSHKVECSATYLLNKQPVNGVVTCLHRHTTPTVVKFGDDYSQTSDKFSSSQNLPVQLYFWSNVRFWQQNSKFMINVSVTFWPTHTSVNKRQNSKEDENMHSTHLGPHLSKIRFFGFPISIKGTSKKRLKRLFLSARQK